MSSIVRNLQNQPTGVTKTVQNNPSPLINRNQIPTPFCQDSKLKIYDKMATNGIVFGGNKSLANLIQVEKAAEKRVSFGTYDLVNKENFNANPTAEIKKNFSQSNEQPSLSPANMRLLYHLIVEHQKENNLNESWTSILQKFNFVTKLNCTVEEIKRIWKRLPAMEKRKLVLDSFTSDQSNNEEIELAIKKAKRPKTNKNSNNNNSMANNQIQTISIQSNVEDKKITVNNYVNTFQSQPFDFSAKHSDIPTALLSTNSEHTSEVSKTLPSTERNSQQQTDSNELKELSKEELKLKISILKLKLCFLQKQYKKHFDSEAPCF